MICENFFNMRHPRQHIKLRSNEQGFTATELIVVMAIIAVLVAIAIPSFSTMVPNYRLKAAARNLYSDMQKARLQAIKENTLIGVSFTTVAYPADGGGYTVFIDDGSGGGVAGNAVQDGGETLLWSRPMEKQISLISADIGHVPRFTFTSRGVVDGSQSGNVQIRNSQRWYKLTVYAVGGLKLETNTDGGVTWY